MQILHLSTQPAFRGGERQVAYLHEGLKTAGFDSRLVFNKACREFLSFDDSWGCAAGLQLSAFAFVNARTLENGILHAHDSRAFTLAMGISLLTGTPVVFSRKLASRIRHSAFNAWKYSRAARIVAISEAVAAEVTSAVKSANVEIIHDGVRCNPGLIRSDARSRLGLSDEAVVVGSVGYFTSEKNMPLLLELAKALDDEPRIVFVCIGWVDANARSAAPSNIVFAGIIPEASEYYSAFDCYVSTSIREGLGSALLDAVVRGIPVAALDAGGTRDIFPENDASLIPQGDTDRLIARVKQIVGSIDAEQAHAAELKKYVEKRFSVEAMVSSHVRLYESILAERH